MLVYIHADLCQQTELRRQKHYNPPRELIGDARALKSQEIAKVLKLEVGTDKTQNHHIFGKLGILQSDESH